MKICAKIVYFKICRFVLLQLLVHKLTTIVSAQHTHQVSWFKKKLSTHQSFFKHYLISKFN
jgi:hypothetical protein